MNTLFARNIDAKGRWIRGLFAIALLVGAALALTVSTWLGVLLAVSGLFALFEAFRGWCALRACSIKTRI